MAFSYDVNVIERALNNWYSRRNKNYENWSELFPSHIDKRAKDMAQKNNEWCRDSMITVTPTIILNGYAISAGYILEDLKYLI